MKNKRTIEEDISNAIGGKFKLSEKQESTFNFKSLKKNAEEAANVIVKEMEDVKKNN